MSIPAGTGHGSLSSTLLSTTWGHIGARAIYLLSTVPHPHSITHRSPSSSAPLRHTTPASLPCSLRDYRTGISIEISERAERKRTSGVNGQAGSSCLSLLDTLSLAHIISHERLACLTRIQDILRDVLTSAWPAIGAVCWADCQRVLPFSSNHIRAWCSRGQAAGLIQQQSNG